MVMKFPPIVFALSLMASTALPGALHDATRAGDTNAVAGVLRSDPSAVNSRTNGLTALHLAAQGNAVSVVALLVQAGADVDALTPDGRSPLQLACAADAGDTALWLVENTGTVYTRGLTGGALILVPGEAAQAAALLARGLREHPDSERLNFALGVLYAAIGEPGKSELAFERVLQANPQNDRARFELARVAMAAGRLSVARQAFEEVLARKPQPPVDERIRTYLKDLDRLMSPWRFTARMDAGWLHDDNANVGPSSDIITIAPIAWGAEPLTRLALNPESKPVETDGAYAAAAGSGVYDVGDTAGWMLVGDASCFRNWLNGHSRYDTLFYQVASGARYVGPRDVAQAAVSAARIDSGHEPLVDLYALSPVYLRASDWTPDLTWMTSLQGEIRDYAELTDRNGPFASAGETLRYAFDRGRHALSAGVSVAHDFTRADAFEYTGVTGLLGLEVGLSRRLKLYGSLAYSDSEYEGREVLAPDDRTDRQWQASVGLSATLWRKWGLDLRHQYTDNDSTFDLYEYQRNLTTIGTWVAY